MLMGRRDLQNMKEEKDIEKKSLGSFTLTARTVRVMRAGGLPDDA
jgi:hypothetical protein